MTEVKIQFTKVGVEKISDPSIPANLKALQLKVNTIDDLNKISEKIPPFPNLDKIELGFWDGVEDKVYNELLDDNNVTFEISWEKEKVNFWVVGEEEFKKDDSKIIIDFFPPGSRDKDGSIIRIEKINPQFAGIVKITYQGSRKEPNKDKDNGGGGKNPPIDNSDSTKQKITHLQNQINALEEKLKKQPTSDNSSADKEKLKQLKTEIEALKRKQKDKPQNENKELKDNFPYGLVIGGGVVIVILLITVIFMARSRKR